MNKLCTFPSRGFIIEADFVPVTLPAALERWGLAGMAARTVDGIYLEPRTSIATIVAWIERMGVGIRAFRAAGTRPSWHETVRPAATSRERLTNVRSSTWLPTLPAA